MTQSELKEHLSYSPATGLFRKIKSSGGVKANAVSGTSDKDGYIVIKINKKSYKAHRLAWLYTHGYMPNEIDHINHSRNDNSLSNLRDVSHKTNSTNKSRNKSNTSGVMGVSWNKAGKRWKANITIDGKQLSLGSHVEFSDAVNARKNAEVLYGFHTNHGKD